MPRGWTQVRAGRRTGWVRTNQTRMTTQPARTRRQVQLRQEPGNSFARTSNRRAHTTVKTKSSFLEKIPQN